ncbi:MAG: SIR2 family protein [Bacteroidales bacterium]|nr:SIR2 family protein [Bacteroidales bacterium]
MNKRNIQHIKLLLEQGAMSFMVGAGFSKNISLAFPSWEELLHPMLRELYALCFPQANATEESAFIAQMLAEKTYLELASDYVRRKGYHEAIDLYIEKHTPYLQAKTTGGFALYVDGQCIDEQPDMECHEALMAMNVGDIYTFNYDNALDVVGGVDKVDALRRQQEDNEHKLNQLRMQYSDYQNEISVQDRADAEKQICDIQVDMLRCRQEQENCYQLIQHSYEISLTGRRKNIYKLHGSLRKAGEKVNFGFDGDHHRQYIITQEDYEDYPCRHEAFVNLMKIALLKGTFCLIGFSGNDPNFLTWISWVKDVLDKNPDIGKRSPIYFVHVGSCDIPEDKLQLFKNHYITPVVLKDVYGLLAEKEQMRRFLKDIAPDREDAKQHNDLWGSLRFDTRVAKTKDDLPDFDDDQKKTMDTLFERAEKRRIPSQSHLMSHYRSWARSEVANRLRWSWQSPYLPKLAYLASKDDALLLPQVFTASQINRLMEMIPSEDKALQKAYEQQFARFILLRGEKSQALQEESATFEAVWALLFHLDFSNAWKHLEDWKANSMFDKLRRELMRALFQELDENTVSHLLQREAYENVQDYIFAQDVLPFVSGLWRKNHNLFNSMREDNKDMMANRKTYRDVLDDLTNDLLEPDDVVSFGTRQYVYGMDDHSGNWEISAKILHLMIELSFPPTISHVNFFDKKKWIIVCEQLMEVYPYPCLFFSLLYGNDKTLIKKVAQMYIYSPKLRSLMPQMLDEMLNALLDERCPENIRMAIYLGAPIFAKAVPAEQWQDKFYALFERYDWDQYNSEYDLRNQSAFIKSMASMLTDTELARKMALRCLQRGKLIDHFCNSVLVDLREKLPRRDKEISRFLRNLLAQVDQSAHVYVLLNMRGYLPADKLFDKMLACYDLWRSDENLCYAMAYVSKKHPALQAAVRKAVLESKALWETGIHADGSGVSVLNQDFDINRIQTSVAFSSEEIVALYRRMLPSIGLLEQYLPKWRNHSDYEFLFNDWTELMYIMTRFLKKNEAILAEKQTDYADTLARLERVKHQYKPASIMENLLDDNHTSDAIASLVNAVVDAGPKSYLNEYSLIANKIILQDSAALNSCLKHLSWVMTKYKRHFSKQQFSPLLETMFASYEPYFRKENAKSWTLTTAEKDVAEVSLIKLAKVYESWGGTCFFGKNYQALYA